MYRQKKKSPETVRHQRAEGNVSTVSVALLSLKPQPSFSTFTEVKDGDPRSERRESPLIP